MPRPSICLTGALISDISQALTRVNSECEKHNGLPGVWATKYPKQQTPNDDQNEKRREQWPEQSEDHPGHHCHSH